MQPSKTDIQFLPLTSIYTNYMWPSILQSWNSNPDSTKFKGSQRKCTRLHFVPMMVIMNFWSCPLGLPMPQYYIQSLMNDIFHVVLRRYVLVFFDDILVYSKTWGKHISHLNNVFGTLSIVCMSNWLARSGIFGAYI